MFILCRNVNSPNTTFTWGNASGYESWNTHIFLSGLRIKKNVIKLIYVLANFTFYMYLYLLFLHMINDNLMNMFSCFFCVCLHVSLYVSNHFNHCIKLFAPCGTLIGNNKFLFLLWKRQYIFFHFTYISPPLYI